MTEIHSPFGTMKDGTTESQPQRRVFLSFVAVPFSSCRTDTIFVQISTTGDPREASPTSGLVPDSSQQIDEAETLPTGRVMKGPLPSQTV